MENLISFLTNIEFDRLGEASTRRLAFNVPWEMAWVILILAGVVLAGTLYVGQLYRRESVVLRPRLRYLLTALRVICILVVAFILLGPKLVMQKEIPKEESIVILADLSRSMTLPWATQDPAALAPLGQAMGQISPRRNVSADPLDANEIERLSGLTRLEVLKHILTDGDLDLIEKMRDTYNVTVFGINTPPRGGEVSGTGPGIVALGVYPKRREGEDGPTGPLPVLPEDYTELGAISPIGRNMRLALRRMADTPGLGGRAVVGMIYLGDGRVTEGETLRTTGQYLDRQGVPVYAVGLGHHKAPPDQSVGNLLIDSVLARGQEATATFRISATGFDTAVARSATFEVFASEVGGEPHAVETRVGSSPPQTSHTVAIPPGAETVDCEVIFKPEEAGRYIYEVRIRPAPMEVITDNNIVRRLVEVSDVKIKVLLIDHYPRWEYRFLRDMIVRDTERIDSACFLIFDWANVSPEGTMGLQMLPNTIDELAKFDVIIIGDMPMELLSTAMARTDGRPFVEMLHEYVSRREGGVIFMTGESYNPFEYGVRQTYQGREYSLADLLPIEIFPDGKDANRNIVITQGFRLEVTAEGHSHPIMKFVEDERENRRLWQSLEELFWFAPVTGVKPGATVLAAHPTKRVEGTGRVDLTPVIATQRYGAGQVLYMGIDETWRWRFRAGDYYTARFWNAAIRHVARKPRSEYIKLEIARDQYHLGETVEVTAQLWRQDGEPLVVERVMAEAVPEDRGREPISIELTPMRQGEGEDAPRTTDGRYQGTFIARYLGAYEVVIRHPDEILVTIDERQQVEVARLNMMVSEPQLEYENPAMAIEELQELADITRGRFVSLDEVSLLPNILKERHQPDYVDDEFAIDRAPLLFLIFLMAITAEWIVRKLNRML